MHYIHETSRPGIRDFSQFHLALHRMAHRISILQKFLLLPGVQTYHLDTCSKLVFMLYTQTQGGVRACPLNKWNFKKSWILGSACSDQKIPQVASRIYSFSLNRMAAFFSNLSYNCSSHIPWIPAQSFSSSIKIIWNDITYFMNFPFLIQSFPEICTTVLPGTIQAKRLYVLSSHNKSCFTTMLSRVSKSESKYFPSSATRFEV